MDMKQMMLLLLSASLLMLTNACGGCKSYKTEKALEEAYAKTDSTWVADTIYRSGLQYCYGTVWANDRLLISNYGGEQLDPLNISKTGYILQLKEGVLSEYIPVGKLMAPKGMAVYNNHLFVADINGIMVFNMNNLDKEAQVISFPEDNLFVSDLVFRDNYLYASVRDANLIYQIEIDDSCNMNNAELDVYLPTVDGPNGMAVYKDTMYICSYPTNDSIGERNSIYMVLNMLDVSPILYKLESLPGYYCGIQYDPNKRMVYYTDRINGQLRSINMETGNNVLLFPEKLLMSPQMLTLHDGNLYVPDVDASALYVFTIPPKRDK